MEKPKIRFKGYQEDWEQRKLGDVGAAKSGIGFPNAEQGGTKGVPFFKVSDMNTEGNENELVVANNYVTEEQIARKRWIVIDEVPAIFFAKVGAAVMLNRKRLVRFPFLLDNNTMAYIFDKNVWDCEFGKTLFETIDLTKLTQVGALPSYNASDVEEVEICIPKKEEQEVIGRYFKNLDHLITLHHRKYTKILICHLFAWEQRKLDDVLKRRIEQRQQSEEYPRLAFASGQGVIPLSERKTNNREQLTKDEYTKKYLVTELNDIVYNPANVKYGAIDRNKCGRGLISPIYVTFTTNEVPGFIERIVTSHDFQQRALRFEEGTVTKRQSVNPEDLVTLDILVAPKREEQQKIATYFDSLDHLITLHQQKCDELRNIKKFMLQNMFI